MIWLRVLVVMITAFLLARVVLFDSFVPFALPWLVYLYLQKKRIGWLSVVASIGGAATVGWPVIQTLLLQWLLFLFVYSMVDRLSGRHRDYFPLYILICNGTIHLLVAGITGGITGETWLLSLSDAFMSMLFSMVLIHAKVLDRLEKRSFPVESNEWICVILVVVLALSGLKGLEWMGIDAGDLASRCFVLFAAVAGGGAAGAIAGLMTGFTLHLPGMADMSGLTLFVIAGMLAGWMRKGGTTAVIAGFWMGAMIVNVYSGDRSLVQEILTMLAATGLFLCIPERWIERVSAHLPDWNGSANHTDAASRMIHNKAATRIRQFASMFRQLGMIFKQPVHQSIQDEKQVIEESLRTVMERHCQTCERYESCWGQQFPQTVANLGDMIRRSEQQTEQTSLHVIPPDWSKQCIKAESVWNTLLWIQTNQKRETLFQQKIGESRNVVANQLYGVSEVMDHMADDLFLERRQEKGKEEQIRQSLLETGIQLRRVRFISLTTGDVHIIVEHAYPDETDPCRTMLAPVFSSILKDNVCMTAEKAMDSNGILKEVTFRSMKRFVVDIGVAGRAKRNGLLSGDSHMNVDLGDGRLAFAISDGMGNGQRALQQSSAALGVLKQLLQSGMDQKTAIRSVNSVLMLRSEEEMYATMDMACIDLNCGIVTFMKNGSTPSFIKRGNDLIAIHSSNLPVGIVDDIDVEVIRFQLIPGDLLIMMSDGIYDALGWMIDKERYLKRLLNGLNTDDPEQTADWMMSRLTGNDASDIRDDMTVLVARVGRYANEWSTVGLQTGRMIGQAKMIN